MQGNETMPKPPNDSSSRQDSATAAVGETLTPDSKPAPYDLKEDPLVQRVARRHGISLRKPRISWGSSATESPRIRGGDGDAAGGGRSPKGPTSSEGPRVHAPQERLVYRIVLGLRLGEVAGLGLCLLPLAGAAGSHQRGPSPSRAACPDLRRGAALAGEP